MNRNISLALAAIILATAQPAKAQEQVKIWSIQYKPSQEALFNETFRKCLGEQSCSLQMQFQLLDELQAEMAQDMSQIKKHCADAGYKNCIDSQRAAIKDWHRTNVRLVDLMRTVEGRQGDLIAGKNPD